MNRPRSCSRCMHGQVCLMRGGIDELVRDFKLLATDEIEARNCGCSGSVAHLFTALASACTVFVEV